MVDTKQKATKKEANRFDPRLIQARVGHIESLLSRAVMYRPITLKSLHAQRVIWRQYLSLRRSLFSISVILPLLFQDDYTSIEAVETIIDNRFNEARKTLNTIKAQLQKTLSSDGITGLSPFSSALNLNVAYDTPYASQYLDLVLELDDVVQHIETMWLAANIDNRHRKLEVDRLEKLLMRLSVSIVQEERRIRNAAKRKGIETNVEEELSPGTVDVQTITTGENVTDSLSTGEPVRAKKARTETPVLESAVA